MKYCSAVMFFLSHARLWNVANTFMYYFLPRFRDRWCPWFYITEVLCLLFLAAFQFSSHGVIFLDII
jgi:hypothetical protein